jgi:hypothetical protein
MPRAVHARVAAEAEDVLRRDDGEARARAHGELDQPPVRLGGIEAGLAAPPGGERAIPADRRVGVVRRGVDDLPRADVRERVRVAVRAAERPQEFRLPGLTQLFAQALFGRRDHTEVLRDQR